MAVKLSDILGSAGPGDWNYSLTEKTDTATTTSTTFVDTGMSVSITPREGTSKILILAAVNVGGSGAGGRVAFGITDSSNNLLLQGDADGSKARVTFVSTPGGSNASMTAPVGLAIVDAVNTDARTYKLRWLTGSGTARLNRVDNEGDYAPFPRAASTLLALEIPQ